MRKKLPKILKSIFLIIFIFQMLGLIVILTLPSLSHAIDFTPQVNIPNSEVPKQIGENSIGLYIKSIYKYAIGIVGIVAAVVLMMGGVIWLTAGGNQTRIGEAKAWIGASLTGLIIALTSYMILYTVNPVLVQFRPINVADVEEMGCCQNTNNTCSIVSKSKCDTSKWKGTGSTCDTNDGQCKTKTQIELTQQGNGCCLFTLDTPGPFNQDKCDNTDTQQECLTKCNASDIMDCSYTQNYRCNQASSGGVFTNVPPCIFD